MNQKMMPKEKNNRYFYIKSILKKSLLLKWIKLAQFSCKLHIGEGEKKKKSSQSETRLVGL